MNSFIKAGRSAGFTLIEMMAALLISSVLLLAMYQNFIVTHRTYQLLEGFSLLQENARFSSDVMARTIRMAGYRKDPGIDMATVFKTANGSGLFHTLAAGQLVSGEDNNTSGSDVILNGTDSISIRYQGDDMLPTIPGTFMVTDCIGTDVTDTYGSVNIFYIDTSHVLKCKPVELNYDTGNQVGTPSSQPLIEGAEDMQILYGVDNSGSLTADNYLNAGEMTATDWLNVVSVRISVLYNTVNRVPQTAPQSFTMLDNGTSSFNDGLRRQLFTATINLRNRSQ